MSIKSLLVVCGVLGSSIAVADPLSDSEMKVVEPGRVADRAEFKPGRIAWCPPGRFSGEAWEHNRLRRATDSLITSIERSGSDVTYLGDQSLDAAEHLCQWPDDKGWQKQVMYFYQAVMNSQKVSQDEAVELVKKWITLGRAAREKANRPKTDEDRFEFPEHSLKPVTAEPGVDTAKITGTIPWCDKAANVNKDRWEPGRIDRTINTQYGIQGLIEGSYHLCQRPNDTTWKQRATYALQQWMNWTKQPQDAAVQSLRTRIQLDKVKSDFTAMCKGLELPAEVGGQAKAYGEARQKFFGCGGRDGQELWREPNIAMGDQVGFYLDADTELDSEIVRMYWLFGQTRDPHAGVGDRDASANKVLLDYAVASADYAKLDAKAIDKELAKAPLNNELARAVASESLATLRWRRKLFEEAIDKLAKGGSEYTDILRGAPKAGFAQWEKVTGPWKAELARSYAFEKKLSEPSRKVLQGCSKELMPDAQKLIKSYKKSDYNQLTQALASDPIAQLLLNRLAVCFAAEKVVGGSGALKDIVKRGRDLRGPRSMAYYAIVDALTKALEDRPKLLLSHSNFHFRMQSLVDIYGDEFRFTGSAPSDPKDTYSKGIVKEAKKSGDGIQIVFKTVKLKFPEYSCVSTRKPIRITSDGRIEYQQNCTATGRMLSQDETPRPVTISAALAAGVKPGAYIVTTGAGDGAVVVYVAKKAEDKKIQTFFGFTL